MRSSEPSARTPGSTRWSVPAPGWVVGIAPLPGGAPDDPAVRSAGLVFAEGRDAAGATSREGAERVASLARDRPGGLGEFAGDFTFLAFGEGAVTAVRAAAGLAPLYVAEGGDVLGTRLRWVAEHAGPPRIDPLVVAMWIHGLGMFPDGRSPLRGVRVVERGTAERLGGPRAAPERYWDPRPDRLPRPDAAVRAEHADRFRSVLLERLAADLDPDGGNWLGLSGGIDSASLLCLSAGTLGLPVSAISMLPGSDEALRIEAPYFRSAIGRGPLRRHVGFRVDERVLVPNARGAMACGFPVPHPVLQPAVRIAAAEGMRVYFGGEFGDEVGGSRFTFPDWVAATPPWRALLGPWPAGPRDAARWVRERARPRLSYPDVLPDWFDAGVREEYREWRERERRRGAADRRPLAGLAARDGLGGFVVMNWEALSQVGVRRSTPFFNRAMLELAYACHPGELVAPGYRRLVRAALRADVPAPNLRTDKVPAGVRNAGPVAFDETLSEALSGVVRPDWHPRPPGPIAPALARRLWMLVRFGAAYRLAGPGEPEETAHVPYLDTPRFGP